MSSACYHCGETIPSGFDARLTIANEERAFCCYGCMAIAEAIVSGGMEQFYRHRSALSKKPDAFQSDELEEFRLYDDPELQNEFVQTNDQGESEAHLIIGGITCAACIWLLEKEISRTDGVVQFTINHSSHRGTLIWQRDQVPLSQILMQVRRLGFRARPFEEDAVRQQALSERRTGMFRLALAGIAMMQNMMFSVPLYLGLYSGIDEDFVSLFRWVSMLMCTPVVFYSAQPFFIAALRDLKTRHLTMDVPVSIAILGAYLASAYITMFTPASLESDVYFDSVSMFAFFLLLGRFIEMQTRHRHLNSDGELQQLLPVTATRLENGREVSIPAHKIQTGDLLRIKQGQTAPADGILLEGRSHFDESALNGEYLPVLKQQGDMISGGTANIDSTVTIQTTHTPKESRVASIIRLLDRAEAEKPATALMADKVAGYFVGAVLLTACVVGAIWTWLDVSQAFKVVLSVLVVTCPCALSLATPTALTAANTRLRESGFLIARGHVIEAMTQATDIIFDKTGTLTEGKLVLQHIDMYEGVNQSTALAIAAALEADSAHPIAKAFAHYHEFDAENVQHHVGAGVCGEVGGQHYRLGTHEFVLQTSSQATTPVTTPHQGACVYLSDGEHVLARFLLNDALRSDAKACVKALQAQGHRIHILSGDHEFSVRHMAMQLGIEHFRFAQSPEQKLAYVRQLEQQGARVVMLGDGINDLPVLSGAGLSIAMGGASDLTKLQSDAVLLNSQLATLSEAFRCAQRTRSIIRQNMGWAIGYNLIMLPLAAAALVPPYFAALGMSLSSLLVVANSLRVKR
ncbi:MAG: heavy metal translocating P-type ATPase [Oleiphilaceae bacterium]|nr:heavy metal translocating P-type ATPase [Oleiphilaceae bacterium]